MSPSPPNGGGQLQPFHVSSMERFLILYESLNIIPRFKNSHTLLMHVNQVSSGRLPFTSPLLYFMQRKELCNRKEAYAKGNRVVSQNREANFRIRARDSLFLHHVTVRHAHLHLLGFLLMLEYRSGLLLFSLSLC